MRKLTKCVARADLQDPKRRATANQVLSHPWMRENGTASSKPLDNIILRRMQVCYSWFRV